MSKQAAREDALIRRIRRLSPEKLAEVEDFVEFLAERDDRHLTEPPRSSPRRPSAKSETIPAMSLTTGYSFGEVVLVPFPFTSTPAYPPDERPRASPAPACSVVVDAAASTLPAGASPRYSLRFRASSSTRE